MKLLLSYRTSVGTFYIGQSKDGRFHPIFNGESYGSYAQIFQASEDLAGGHTFSIIDPRTLTRIDTSRLGIPYDPREWSKA